MKKVSIIVPVYNVESYLEQCLLSLVNQTLKDIEVIIVNDGSPDDSQKIIDKYVKEYPDIFKSYSKPNGGLSDARNYGMKYASGKYISFVDSDDYVSEDYAYELYTKAKNTKSDIVVCEFYKEYDNKLDVLSYDINNSHEFLTGFPSACNKIFRREFLESNNFKFKKGIYYEDLEAIIPLGFCNPKITSVKKPLYYYVTRNESIMTQKKYNTKMESIYVVIDSIIEKSKKCNVYDEYKDEIEWICISRLLHDFGIVFMKYEEAYKNLIRNKEIISERFPNWENNKYFNNQSIKYKITTKL